MKITYRQVNLLDANEMQTIAAIDMTIPALFDPSFEVNEKTIADRLAQLMECKPHDFFDVVVNTDGKIIGFHFMNQFKSPPSGAMAAHVQTLWVDPAFRKQGIAKTLKERGEKWAKEHKLSHIATFVHCHNTSMLPLNKKLGYEIVGYQMRKSLG